MGMECLLRREYWKEWRLRLGKFPLVQLWFLRFLREKCCQKRLHRWNTTPLKGLELLVICARPLFVQQAQLAQAEGAE
ncbi:MAG TPA: hypothetical protein DCL75_17030 [Ktedonobacter sp.]|nr:hypothetical protein [Ktedonobacter sp.]